MNEDNVKKEPHDATAGEVFREELNNDWYDAVVSPLLSSSSSVCCSERHNGLGVLRCTRVG